jgi:hypothetical protein
VVVGTPGLSVEASVATPGDNSAVLRRRTGLGGVVRVQGFYKALVIGVSHINSEPYVPASYPGRMAFSGVDVRWTHAGIQLRGEWMAGQPWDGQRTIGGYADASIHRPFMGPVTIVFRSERLSYLADAPFEWHGTPGFTDWVGSRQTAGGRIRLPAGLTAQVNVFRHSGLVAHRDRAAFDVGLTYSIRRQTPRRTGEGSSSN